jgi:hypothetical protein
MTGGTESTTNGFGDILIIKTDATGNIQWQKIAGGSDYDNGYDVRQTTDGGYIICGFQYTDSITTDDACLMKLDASGNVSWMKKYTGSADEYFYTVEQTADGGYITGGETYYNPGDEALILKTDASGNVQWAKAYGGGTDYWVVRIMNDVSGNYFVAGTASQPNYLNAWLAKLDNSGTPVWSNTYAGAGTLEDNCIWATRTSDGGFVLGGGSESFTPDYECFLLKTDSTGGPEWSKRYGGSSNDNVVQIVQTADGGFVFGANTLSFGGGASAYLVKTNAVGTSTCNENIPAFITTNVTTAVSAASINASTISNSTTTSMTAASQPFTETTQCLTVGADEIETGENEILIYPNPASGRLTVGSRQSAVESIELFDMTGRRAFSQQQTTNSNLQSIDISSLTSGMYIVRIRTENREVLKKLVKD